MPEPGGSRPVAAASDERLRWALATESIAVKIRWLGIIMGYILVQSRTGLHNPSAVRAFLALGAGFAALDLAFYWMGEVFLQGWPLFISLMESVFIALLCYHDTGLASPFRWYYLLSLICCAIRYRPPVAWLTFGIHCVSLLGLSIALGPARDHSTDWPLTLAIMAWATWASSALATHMRRVGERFEQLNRELEAHQAELELRVSERTAALRASQARVIQQEKMAAFGLLAAGIAHEVGNPLAALSSLVQMLQRRGPDAYTAAKLEQAAAQLGRIQRTIRELVDFSRPASTARARIRPVEAVEEALGIAKYYQRTKQREITTEVSADLPAVRALRDHLVQVVLNLVLNAIDATEKGGRISLASRAGDGWVELAVQDDGRGITEDELGRLFQPFFTTKAHGTGLGLFVCRQIVEEMGGRITCQSEPGCGSTFTVRMPAERPEPVLSLSAAASEGETP